jgi:CheY-like chemotaxis protein
MIVLFFLSMYPTILVVDDSARVARAAEEVIGSDGYHAISAGNGLRAIERLRQESVDLLVTDFDLFDPTIDLNPNGVDLVCLMRGRKHNAGKYIERIFGQNGAYEEFVQRYQDTPVVMMSRNFQNPDRIFERLTDRLGVCARIPKYESAENPFEPEQLLEAVRTYCPLES